MNRRSFLWVAGATSTFWGCSKTPAAPTFLTDFQLLTREGASLPEKWMIPNSRPIDPVIQYYVSSDHPREYEGRKVVPESEWLFVANVEKDGVQLPLGNNFRSSKWFGEEFIGDSHGELIWESPDCPKNLPPGKHWQWCHFRVPEDGEYSLVVYLLPTVIRIGGDETMLDHGVGVEVARNGFVLESGESAPDGLTMATMNAEFTPRSVHKKLRLLRKKRG